MRWAAIWLLFSLISVTIAACGESKEARLERYRKVAAEKYQWAGPAGVGLAAYKASRRAWPPDGDYEVAFAEWKPLAEAGNADAQSFLANMYFAGHGVKKDRREAARWYRRAIAQGSWAPISLAEIYEQQDEYRAETLAYAWLKIAAARKGSDFLTKSNEDKVRRRMTPAQIEEAEQFAHRFLEVHQKPR